MRYLLIAAIACFCLAGCVHDPYYYDDGPSYNVNRNVNRSYHHTTHHRPAPHHHHHHGHR